MQPRPSSSHSRPRARSPMKRPPRTTSRSSLSGPADRAGDRGKLRRARRRDRDRGQRLRPRQRHADVSCRGGRAGDRDPDPGGRSRRARRDHRDRARRCRGRAARPRDAHRDDQRERDPARRLRGRLGHAQRDGDLARDHRRARQGLDRAGPGGLRGGPGRDDRHRRRCRLHAANGTLTIAAGTLGATIPLAIVNDALDENDEQIVVQLSNPSNAELGTTTRFTYTILNNDPSPTVSITTASSSVGESVGTTTLTVALSAASGKDITVTFAGTGTATEGADYAYTPADHAVVPGGHDDADDRDRRRRGHDRRARRDRRHHARVAGQWPFAGAPNITTILDDDPMRLGPAGNYQVCLAAMPDGAGHALGQL